MECTVHGPVHADFELVWFRVALGPGEGDDIVRLRDLVTEHDPAASVMHNSSDVTIRFQLNQDGAVKRIRSRLELQLNREDSASNTAFWCSVLAWPNSTADATDKPPRALPSEAFVLRVADVYADLPICGGTPQSSEGEKCATVFRPLLQPATPSSNTSVTASIQSVSTMIPAISSRPVIAPSSLPTTSVLLDPSLGDLNEGQTGLNSIVLPMLGVLGGAICALSLVACLYLRCHYHHKKSENPFVSIV